MSALPLPRPLQSLPIPLPIPEKMASMTVTMTDSISSVSSSLSSSTNSTSTTISNHSSLSSSLPSLSLSLSSSLSSTPSSSSASLPASSPPLPPSPMMLFSRLPISNSSPLPPSSSSSHLSPYNFPYHHVEIVDSRVIPPYNKKQFYIHFVGINKRLDKWVGGEEIFTLEKMNEMSQINMNLNVNLSGNNEEMKSNSNTNTYMDIASPSSPSILSSPLSSPHSLSSSPSPSSSASPRTSIRLSNKRYVASPYPHSSSPRDKNAKLSLSHSLHTVTHSPLSLSSPSVSPSSSLSIAIPSPFSSVNSPLIVQNGFALSPYLPPTTKVSSNDTMIRQTSFTFPVSSPLSSTSSSSLSSSTSPIVTSHRPPLPITIPTLSSSFSASFSSSASSPSYSPSSPQSNPHLQSMASPYLNSNPYAFPSPSSSPSSFSSSPSSCSSPNPSGRRLTRRDKRMLETTKTEIELDELDGHHLDAIDIELEKEHQEKTKVKNINTVVLGKTEIDCWYYSPFPHAYRHLSTIYFCEYCLFYMSTEQEYSHHYESCRQRHPPGNEIYRDDHISVFEVDGDQFPLYCQCLCLLGKFFIDHKTAYYDVEPFLFYILCESDKDGYHVVAYFSKEKHSVENNNVACILTFPHHQRKGYGKFLISLSYGLSQVECKSGSPEKPLSDLGRVSYRSYWSEQIFHILMDTLREGTSMGVEEISSLTSIKKEDIISTLRLYDMIRFVKGSYIITMTNKISEFITQQLAAKMENPNNKIFRKDKLVWTPPVFPKEQIRKKLKAQFAMAEDGNGNGNGNGSGNANGNVKRSHKKKSDQEKSHRKGNGSKQSASSSSSSSNTKTSNPNKNITKSVSFSSPSPLPSRKSLRSPSSSVSSVSSDYSSLPLSSPHHSTITSTATRPPSMRRGNSQSKNILNSLSPNPNHSSLSHSPSVAHSTSPSPSSFSPSPTSSPSPPSSSAPSPVSSPSPSPSPTSSSPSSPSSSHLDSADVIMFPSHHSIASHSTPDLHRDSEE